MISQYAINILGKKPDPSKDCSAFLGSISGYNEEMQKHMILACQLNIMGILYEGTPMKDFLPDDYLSRADFGTAFSRLLW
jgi:hypothetical protein